jgi:hypothetical protein
MGSEQALLAACGQPHSDTGWARSTPAERRLNPTAVAKIQHGWPGSDPGTANTVVIFAAVLILVWDSVDRWRKTLAA